MDSSITLASNGIIPTATDATSAAGLAGAGALPAQAEPEFLVLKQRVDLDVDLASQTIRGSTEISIQPLIKTLKHVRLHSRQARPTAVQAGGISAKWELRDSYRRASRLQAGGTSLSGVKQHEMLKGKVRDSLAPFAAPELEIALPAKLKIQELAVDSAAATAVQFDTAPPPPSATNLHRQESDAGANVAETPTIAQQMQLQQGPQFAPIKLYLEFEVERFRDGVHWIGCIDGDKRFPYCYTKAEPWPGNTSCIFPCVDDVTSRCSWDISIRCARTVGDAFRISKSDVGDASRREDGSGDVEMVNGVDSGSKGSGTVSAGDSGSKGSRTVNGDSHEEYLVDLSEGDAALDLTVLCVGEMIEDVVDSEDESRHTVSFSLLQPVTARHFGFAIGPFEQVDLSSIRNTEEEERLGQSAVKVNGFCLPGRSQEVQNTCLPIAWAIDFFGVNYGSYPFASYQMLFVDDFVYDTVATAGFAFCNASLLFPRTVIEPTDRNTRKLVRALAEQWIGVNIIPKEVLDSWVVAGMAGFMTDLYMKKLAGNNEFRWQQKQAAEKVYELDVDRPSLQQLGNILHLDQSIRDFVDLKSALVLFILDRRLMKASGTTGVTRIINKIFLNAKTGTLVNGEISTADFQRTCERLGHNKLEAFFRQWVFLSGCPIFHVTQRFNKKKLVVEMTIVQRQLERQTKPAFEPSNFMREIKEHVQEVWAPETNAVFTGPMTIRIHEADGTPYEHIVEIKEPITKLEIPYNTKYKRLKRSRRQKERQAADGPANNEGGDDALLYCLGDILDTDDDRKDWNLREWTEEDEEKMGQESYEWIRMDADFEWIGKIHLVLPLYMYVSQLQQDRDIVAQYDSMRYLLGSNPHHVNLTILVRTLMDSRYFWGIREMAAEGLATCAKASVFEIGQCHLTKAYKDLYFMREEDLPKPNDFSDRRSFIIQCAIPRAMAMLRDEDGKVPLQVRKFFIDLLKFNDNSNNRLSDGDPENSIISDCHFVATLMNCLADSVIASHREVQPTYDFSFGDEEEPLPPESNPDSDFAEVAIAQIDRHRRIDEWDPSYQNLYSTTALDCLQRLANAGIARKNAEIMKYVRGGNADNVRITAYRCLSEIGILRNMAVMRYLLYQLVADPSPYFRHHLLKVFGEALGHIALGDGESKKAPAQAPAESGLVLEQEVTTEERRLEVNRKASPEGAIQALKAVLHDDEKFKEALWYAATSPDISLDEIAAFCDIAALIYEPVLSQVVVLNLPQMWRCSNLGKGKVKFNSYGPFRTAPKKGLEWEDFQSLQKLKLTYSGPLAPEIKKKQQEESQRVDEAAALKLRIAQTQEMLQQAQTQDSQELQSMPPPLVTPSTEKTGFKLSLGGKRKQSVDFSPRTGSPKAPKLSRPPSTSGTPAPKLSPESNRARSSTPGSVINVSRRKGAKQSKVVKLRLGANAARAQHVLSALPQPGRGPSNGQASASLLPNLTQSPTNGVDFFGRGANAFTTSPQSSSMHLGSFRSYGPASAEPSSSPHDAVEGASAEVKQENGETPGPSSTPALPSFVNALPRPSSLSMSPPVPLMQEAAAAGNNAHMGPPPKPPAPQKKLTLKLVSSRKTSEERTPE